MNDLKIEISSVSYSVDKLRLEVHTINEKIEKNLQKRNGSICFNTELVPSSLELTV